MGEAFPRFFTRQIRFNKTTFDVEKILLGLRLEFQERRAVLKAEKESAVNAQSGIYPV